MHTATRETPGAALPLDSLAGTACNTTDTSAATESHSVYSEIWSSLAASSSSGEVLNRDGVLITHGGGKWPVMNTAFLTSPVKSEADLQDRILIAKRYYEAKKALWL